MPPTLWLVLAALAFSFAGCATGGAGRCADAPSVGAPASAPHTLPEAVCAYLKCLHACPCDGDGPPAKGKEEEKKADKNGTRGEEGEGRKGPRKIDGPAGSNGNGSQGKKNPEGDGAGADGGGRKDGKGTRDATGEQGKKNPPEGGGEAGKEGEKEKDDKGDEGEKKEGPEPQWYSAHGQATVVTQTHDRFPSPYVGPNSLRPREPAATSATATLFYATRLWEGGELVFNPEVAGGRGFSGTTGLAGFTNGEITRVGIPDPTPYVARLLFRQAWGLGGEREKVEDAPNQVAGTRDVDRFTLSVGKMAATDVADDNRYSHDPRTAFLNWSLMYDGAWDYPANVRGYTYGLAAELNRRDWAVRYGVFAEPAEANGATIDPRFLKANGHAFEFEERYTVNERPGKLRLLAFFNNAHMGNYREALAESPIHPDVTATRAYRTKYGFGLSGDQELTRDLGLFGRLGWNDGRTESWAFTEIDRTASLGLSLRGACWCRPRDVLGVACVVNGLSGPHRDYLAAGGLGFIIGDGRLRYGPEEVFETFYNFELRKGIVITGDFQGVNHPAYNRDRGPVYVGTLRVHFEL